MNLYDSLAFEKLEEELERLYMGERTGWSWPVATSMFELLTAGGNTELAIALWYDDAPI